MYRLFQEPEAHKSRTSSRTRTRTIFKIWRRQSAGNENKIPVTIRITELRFFAGYAAKKWPPFGAAEALFQELRARRENELKLVLVRLLRALSQSLT